MSSPIPTPAFRTTWRGAALVAAGGFVGTGLRFGLAQLISSPDAVFPSFPSLIFAINLLGAFALGVLVGAAGRHRDLQLLLGTGLLGGFTTYSALATDTALLLRAGDLTAGLGYPLLTVVLGGALSLVGLVLGARFSWGTALPEPNAGAEQ